MVIALVSVELDVDRILSLVFLHLIIITRSESVDVTDRSMDKDFVVDQWRELEPSQSESHMTFGG